MSRARVLGGKAGRRAAAVEMAPLIDMVFILLIFFVVTTSFVKEAGVEVSRPESAFAERVEEGFLPVAIDKGGGVHAAGRVLAPDAVRSIAALLSESGHKRVVIQADREVPTALLLEVMDTCKLAGARSIDVAAVGK